MPAMTYYTSSNLINQLFRSATFSKPPTIAIALCTSAPSDSQDGSSIPEVANSGAYARVNMGAPSDTTWTMATNNATTSNVAPITFPQANANWNAPVTHVAILDNANYGAGNLLFWGPLASVKTITNGDTFQFAAGQLSIQLDN